MPPWRHLRGCGGRARCPWALPSPWAAAQYCSPRPRAHAVVAADLSESTIGDDRVVLGRLLTVSLGVTPHRVGRQAQARDRRLGAGEGLGVTGEIADEDDAVDHR